MDFDMGDVLLPNDPASAGYSGLDRPMRSNFNLVFM
jgi:hypothetical protein